MKTRLSLFLVLVASLALAQDKQPETFTLRGKVVDADGKPVAGAVVEVRSQAVGMENSRSDVRDKDDLLTQTETDDQGGFSFVQVALPQGDGEFSARRYAWFVLARASGHGLAWNTLNLNSPTGEVRVQLAPARSVAGKVLNVDGKPVSNAQVKVVGLQQLGSARTLPVPYLGLHRSKLPLHVRTDAEGRFRIEGLPRDVRVDLQVSEENYVVGGVYAATTDQPQPKIVQRYSDAKGLLRTREQEVYTGEVMVKLEPGHRVVGQVVSADTGSPVALTWLYLQSEQGSSFPDRTDAEGRFRRGQLPPGKYTVSVQPPEKSDYINATGSLEIPADQTEVKHDFKLPRGAIVDGKVVDEETGAAIRGVTVFYTGPANAHAVTERDGGFRIAVPAGPGKLQISASIPGYFLPSQPIYRRPATGSEPPTDDPFTRSITAKLDQPLKDITFKLGKGLSISGQVVDTEGKPVSGAKLVPISTWNVQWNNPAATSDDAGRFTVTGLDPAKKHQILILHEARKLAGVLTTQAPKDKKRLDDVKAKVEPQATMTGRVIDEDQKPIEGATVYAYISIQFEQDGQTYGTSFPAFAERPTKTDKHGRFFREYLIPGMPHQARVDQEGYSGSFSNQFLPKGGEKHEVGDLRLVKADQSVAGVVVDPAGRPLAGIRVYATSRGGGLAYVSSEQIHTDKDGRFKVDNLPRGSVEINARSESDAQGISMSNRVNAQAGQTDIRIVMFLTRNPPPIEALIGKPAPEFPVTSWLRGPTTAKRTFQPAEFQGKVLVLAFVDEAKPSLRVLPLLQAFREKFGDRVAVLRVHELGDAEDLGKLSPLPAVIASGGIVPGYAEAHAKYGVRATPTLFLVDRQGVLRHGDVKLDELDAKVKALLP
jgi:protocatechuate 3,4-dioxygenase beta subunit